MSAKITRLTRLCPECQRGRVESAELHQGVQCPNCQRLIEMDFRYSAGIPIVMALLVTAFYQFDLTWLGHLVVLLMILFVSSYKSVLTSWLPLRFYGDE